MFWIAAIAALVSVAILGIVHHFGILALRRMLPAAHAAPYIVPAAAFQGLLILHVIEILLFALFFRWVQAWPGIGQFTGDWAGSATDYIVFSAVTFSTLGMTGIKLEGPLRMVVMAESLGGFMVLTWSATFLYTVWSRHWDQSES